MQITSVNYEGLWVQQSTDQPIQCFGQNETILICEHVDCIINCNSLYKIQGLTASLLRDTLVTGHYDRTNIIRWGDNTIWQKKNVPCSGVNKTSCNVEGESCIDGVCRCGMLASCEGRKSGAYCDPFRGECRCSKNLPSCSDPSRGSLCDAKHDTCKCSETAQGCHGTRHCTLGSCIERISGVRLWPMSAKDKTCKYREALYTHITTNKLACQTLCEQNENCVGVSYSYKQGFHHMCFVCLDDVFDNANEPGVNFYKRPGIYFLSNCFKKKDGK